MNRRSFLFLSVVGPVASLVGAMTTPRGFGYLDVETALARGYLPAQVFLDGVPLSECHTLNDREGWADCWKTDTDGRIVVDWAANPDRPQSIRRYGRVTYLPNPHGRPGEWAS